MQWWRNFSRPVHLNVWLPALALLSDATPLEAWNEKRLFGLVWCSAEYSEISFSFKPANAHSKQCSRGCGVTAQVSSSTLTGGKKEKRLHHDCDFYHRHFSHCLPACPTYLCLNLSYQFLSHSLRLLVIAHHPLIERKGACSVNNLTNLYDLIFLKHMSANIGGP